MRKRLINAELGSKLLKSRATRYNRRMSKIKVLILAGGKGKRMQSDLPKVLIQAKGESMIKRLLKAVRASGVDERPSIIVGFGKEAVMRELGDGYDYIVQEQQLGTGHAVITAEKALKNKTDHVMVLYGDHPFISSETIKKIAERHLAGNGKITMATVRLPDYQDWRATFYSSFSRIIRDKNGNIVKDVQFKDADENEKEVTEVNPCYFCFEAAWLWEKLKTLNTNNAQGEYYLTDLVKIAMEEKIKIDSVEIEASEALGANSKQELEILEKFVLTR
jgi:bifunctional UDP-N-acetylglucosamine pyrophosphorylase / glucosamine-1-phosphate N-acetyltransferase